MTFKDERDNALTESELNHLLKFVGYGSLDAKVWFIGMEEAGGGEDNLRRRLHFPETIDLRDAHELMGIHNLHFGKRRIQPTWRGMCELMLRLEGREPSRETIRDYQAGRLGQLADDGKNVFLAELMPLPKPNVNAWPYERLIPRYTLKSYYKEQKPLRMQLLKDLIAANLPNLVVCYGKRYWLDFEQLFEEGIWIDEGAWRYRAGAPFVVLTPHLTARSMNGQMLAIYNRIIEQI